MKLINFIIKHPLSILLFLPILYGVLQVIFRELDGKMGIFLLNFVYIDVSEIVFTAIYSMVYSYILFLYQLKQVNKSFMTLLVLNVVIVLVFAPMDYFKVYHFFGGAFSGLTLCLLVLFAVNFIYMGFVCFKNRLDMWYSSIVVISGFAIPIVLKYFEDILLPHFVSSSFVLSVLLYTFEFLSYLLPALLFIYFSVRLRNNRSMKLFKFKLYPATAFLLTFISLMPIVILDLNYGRDPFYILLVVFGGFSVFNFFSMIILFLSEFKTLTKGVKKLFIFDFVFILGFMMVVNYVFGKNIIGTLIFCTYVSLMILTPFNALVLEVIGSKNRLKFSPWLFLIAVFIIEAISFVVSFFILSNIAIEIKIGGNVALSLLSYLCASIYFSHTAKKLKKEVKSDKVS